MVKKRVILFACGGLLLIGAVLFGAKAIRSLYAPKAVTSDMPVTSTEVTPMSSPVADDSESVATETPEATPEPTPERPPYVSPIDFAALQAVNPDIYGWLEIEDTNISLPIVQHPTDDTYYLDHDSDRQSSENGAVFSEATYNTNDFTEPVTILYGHHKWSGDIFGHLQHYYTDPDFWDTHPTFTVYLPDSELEYGVFAAVPYDRLHILYYYDFSNDEVFESFFSNVFRIRDLSALFNEGYAPNAGDRVLILSTCFEGNNTRRFLVMAKQLPDQFQ